MRVRSHLFRPIACALATFMGVCGITARAAGRASSEGVYTAEQAARGKTAYQKNCEHCHGSELEGGTFAPSLVGTTFSERWADKSVGDYYSIIQLTMPEEAPGTLTADAYADVVSYVLKMNGFPTGSTELPTAISDLKKISLRKQDK